MKKIFRKEKMVARIIAEGRTDMLTPEVDAIMTKLDGHEADSNCWRNVVHGEPVMFVRLADGTGEYVNEADCE